MKDLKRVYGKDEAQDQAQDQAEADSDVDVDTALLHKNCCGKQQHTINRVTESKA